MARGGIFQMPSGFPAQAPPPLTVIASVGIVLDFYFIHVDVGRKRGNHLDGFVAGIDDVMNFVWLDVDELPRAQVIDDSVDDYVNKAFKNVKILFHDFMVMRLEILIFLELDDCEIHSRAFHQVLGAAIPEPVFFFCFVHDEHIILLKV
jgi:hypothetical protein